jgi:hypothetical protein
MVMIQMVSCEKSQSWKTVLLSSYLNDSDCKDEVVQSLALVA